MAGLPGRSGGWNRLSVEDHQLRGTYRKDRHGQAQEPPSDSYSRADRRRLLIGLPRGARRLAIALLETFGGWDPASLATLRAYSLSCERLIARCNGDYVCAQRDGHAVALPLSIMW